jgi:hypothetical protein
VFPELLYYGLQHFTVAPIRSLLGARLKVAIALKDCGVVNIFAMRGKNAVHAAENSLIPVDESAVAIESENFEPAEVEHGAGHLRGEILRLKT